MTVAVIESDGELPAAGLAWLGCQVPRSVEQKVPAFAARQGGRALAVWTEEGHELSREEVLLLTCLALADAGERQIHLPPACRIVRQMQSTGQSLTQLVRQLPGCQVQRRVVPLRGGRSAVMGALSKRFPDARRMEHGMRVDLEGGSVWVAPAGNQEALRLAAEGPEAEIARELCDFMAREASQWDCL